MKKRIGSVFLAISLILCMTICASASSEGITRGEFVQLLYLEEGSPASEISDAFSDISSSDENAAAIGWAYKNGITNGCGDGFFCPDMSVTNEQAAAMLFRYAQHKNADMTVGENTNILSYDDIFTVPDYATEAFQYVLGCDIMDGNTPSTIDPKDIVTTEEAKLFIEKLDAVMTYAVALDYSDIYNWSYLNEGEGKDADLFIICPTVDMGRSGNMFADVTSEKYRSSFTGALNMELGIYDDCASVYAPYYRQTSFPVYDLDEEDREFFLEYAYQDVRDAFDCYIAQSDSDRPLILAGFSQGSDMMLRLMKDVFDNEEIADRLVAAYCIGWKLTDEDIAQYPHLAPAKAEDDTGVIIAFNTEAEHITSSLIVGENEKSHCINPLNWKTDGTPADKSLNLGACFTDYSGDINEEIAQLTGAYIDEGRGVLKVTDVSPSDYPGNLFEDGVYHLYDYQFFFRNLEENVKTRLDAFMAE